MLIKVSTHSRLKAAGKVPVADNSTILVSTHSRLKAAGPCVSRLYGAYRGFNTQPPEGGWDELNRLLAQRDVSTHSRLKAAGPTYSQNAIDKLFQHTAA